MRWIAASSLLQDAASGPNVGLVIRPAAECRACSRELEPSRSRIGGVPCRASGLRALSSLVTIDRTSNEHGPAPRAADATPWPYFGLNFHSG